VGHAWWGGWGGPRIVNNVVIGRTTVVNVRSITVYRNVSVQNAVVAVRPDRFGRGPVGEGRIRQVDTHRLEPVHGRVDLAPDRASFAAASGRHPAARERAGAPDDRDPRAGDPRPAARARRPRPGAAHRAGPACGRARRGEPTPAVRREPARAGAPAAGAALRHQPPARWKPIGAARRSAAGRRGADAGGARAGRHPAS
jgi:hypothetical protein